MHGNEAKPAVEGRLQHPAQRTRCIEDYALIGDTRTSALVGRDGSIDWLCLPSFDSDSTFAALLGHADHGRWKIAPVEPPRAVRRRYLDGTLVLETDFETSSGSVRLTDFMALPTDRTINLVRMVTGLRGQVPMSTDVRFRFDYGTTVPWLRRQEDGVRAVAGPDSLRLRTPIPLDSHDFTTVGEFVVSAGQTVASMLTWHPSFEREPPAGDPAAMLDDTRRRWLAWSRRCQAPAEWREPVTRSVITLKALTNSVTGGIVAAPTTSLPERIGGERNWDYRYCWLRDATFTLYALLITGYTEEAAAWRRWLIRAAAGDPSKLQIMYRLDGKRRLEEFEVPWLPGFAGSKPVRIGNAAFTQQQLDVYGEVIDCFHACRIHGLEYDDEAWRIELELADYLGKNWRDPCAGIWEQRSEPRRYVHSAVMSWVAIDRSIKAVERFGLRGPVAHWRRLRDSICQDVLAHGFNERRNAFTQVFGGDSLDASALLIALVGFLPASDPRIVGTVEAVRKELCDGAFVRRYRTEEVNDGLTGHEGSFLACSFWLIDNLALMGRE
ncbi:MAG: glycoside hydrolase family 15 protein, partial [Rhodospirillaceae bacterium]